MGITVMHRTAARDILIAEDSATQAQRLQHILEQQGYRVTAAANGRLALEAARRRKPALIISDVVMPEMTGYELCTRIKDDPQLERRAGDPRDHAVRPAGRDPRARVPRRQFHPQALRRGSPAAAACSSCWSTASMRQSEQPGMGLEIFFNGQRHFITADRLQILNLLLSTYEAAIQRNKELSIDAGHAAPDERGAAAADARARRSRATAHA